MSGDKVETKDVMKYETKKLEKLLKKNIKIFFYCNPLVLLEIPKIMLSLKKIKSDLYDSAVSVVEVKTDHPLRMKVFKSKYLKNL